MPLIIFLENFRKNVQLYLIYSLDSLKQQMSAKTAKILKAKQGAGKIATVAEASIAVMLYHGVSACIAAVVYLLSSDPPNWVDEVLTDSEEYFGNIANAISHPVETVEAMAQSANDTYETEGLTYMVSYVVADFFAGKGVEKAVKATKGAKLANKADDAADIAKAADKTEDLAKAAEHTDDITDAAKAAEHTKEVEDVAKTAEHADDVKGVTKAAEDVDAKTGKLADVSEGGSGSDLDGVRIINKKYAGKTFELSGDLGKKYPKGVNFSKEGFPEFEPYSIKKVTINNLEGDAYYDFIKANEAAGYSSTPAGYTWHHVEDGKTMLLVPSDLHGAVRHTGGASLIRKGIRP